MSEDDMPGWAFVEPLDGFTSTVGNIRRRMEGTQPVYGFRADERHANLRGHVHGGMIATLADAALGLTAHERLDRRPCATIQLNIQYLEAVMPGELVEARAEVMRLGRSVVFMRGIVSVGERKVALADGVWKVLRG